MNKIKIIIADDHQLVIDGIKSLLSDVEEMDIVGEALNGNELLDLLKNQSSDIVILDINMPGMDGLKAMQNINSLYVDTKILVLTTYDDTRLIREILKLGAKGYVLKSTGKEELLKAIKALASGGTFFSKEVSEKILKAMMKDNSVEVPQQSLLPISLTKREKEILKLIAMEYTGKEIAAELHISINTVETHRRNLLRKLKAKNTAGLVRYAMKHDII
ncbi:MAG: response regulator transcription factor [Bacteroidetes bacterium]|nr:response regulator transcription factor [Bacteroidota bacterium]